MSGGLNRSGGRAQRIAHMIKAKLVLQPLLAQIELNKIEAAHRLIFVAGWRPFIGWGVRFCPTVAFCAL